MKPDVVVTWPSNCDYPLWRAFIRENRDKLGQVFVVFMDTHGGYDYRSFVRECLEKDWVNVGESPPVGSGQDWRDVAIKKVLRMVTAEWVWFTEQDFLPSAGYFNAIERLTSDNDVVAAFSEKRMHPCSLYIRRALLGSIAPDFSANPPDYDHFGRVQIKLEARGEKIAKIPENLYHHMNGLSHNFRLMSEGQIPVYKKEEFDEYLYRSIKTMVEVNDHYYRTVYEYLKGYEKA